MKTNAIVVGGVFIFVFIVVFFCIVIYLDKDTNLDLYEKIKDKQIVKSPYKPLVGPISFGNTRRSGTLTKSSVVPMKLFQTWHSKDVPPKMKENINIMRKNNPELEYFLYDDDECSQYIKTHFSSDVLTAYNTLIPGAYRADLWRYCVMYIDGGVYLDVKYKCMDGFTFIDIMDREHFVLERPFHWSDGTHGIYNALIIAKPGNPLFFNAIQQIVRNTQTNYYGFNSLYPTGPGLLGKLYFGNIYENSHLVDNFDLVYNIINGKDSIIYKNQIILQSYPEYREEQRIKQKHKHYAQLWNQRAIYDM
jgi:hypothetical protein